MIRGLSKEAFSVNKISPFNMMNATLGCALAFVLVTEESGEDFHWR